MGNCLTKSDNKRERDNDESQQGNHQPIESPKQPNDKRQRISDENRPCKYHWPELFDDEPKSTTKIIDLNDDCLVKIFNYLDLQNLFNAAVANEWLRPATHDVYKRKFGTKPVHICNITNDFLPIEWLSTIVICDLKSCLQYIRCFGSSIKKLTISYNESKIKQYQYVNQYINEYCHASLNEIELHNKPKNSIENFSKPFINVRKITVWNCDIGEQFPLFVEWFPHLHHLELNFVRLRHGFDQAPFQHLTHFVIRASNENEYGIFAAANLLRLNKQVRSLKILDYNQAITMNALLNIIRNNKLINKLDVKFNVPRIPISSTEVQRIVREHQSLIELHLPCYQFTCDNLIALTDHLKSLKSLKFKMQDNFQHAQFISRLNRKLICSQSEDSMRSGQKIYYIELKPKN